MSLKRACLYIRVSTATKSRPREATTLDQDPVAEEQLLRELAAQHGWTVTKVYSDRTSGTKQRRPGLNALMADARRGAFDAVLVAGFDGFAQRVK